MSAEKPINVKQDQIDIMQEKSGLDEKNEPITGPFSRENSLLEEDKKGSKLLGPFSQENSLL